MEDNHAVPAQLEHLRDDTSRSRRPSTMTAAARRNIVAISFLRNVPLAAVIFGVIVVMEMQDVAQSECSGDGQKDDLANGAAAARDVDMCHTRRRKTSPKQRKNGAAKINNGADNMQR